MTPENFWYWLQGFYELNGSYNLTAEQQKMVFEHHQLCANKVTPTVITKDPASITETKQIECTVCQQLGHLCAAHVLLLFTAK